ncbi:uncharacterized protein YcfJ [Caulobacter ginsengisoli]|uniref:17 kDa surface antigen n=1 Tax=Caulobacter ginsengisoli TaxID=400775 RepID=A0ABU0IWQ8_9CAUL|nr:glycine zipper 2TM domain-containing protein [Caulobacter ginsengisoli]MDQ0465781.1 uncharacterized protein YcfJ [Caulobacter ginsengisoli]
MKTLIALATSAAMAVSLFSVPDIASAQSSRSYGTGSPCAAKKDTKGKQGLVTGAIIGGVLGSAVAGRGNKTEGALLGGTVGAVAGNSIGRHKVSCASYPRRLSATRRANCRWVTEYYGGRNHGFEVCRGRDGVWRPSGRA